MKHAIHLFAASCLLAGCLGGDMEPTDSEIAEAREALRCGSSPLAGDFEVVANLDPTLLDTPENLVVVERHGHTYIYVTSLMNGQILRIDADTAEVLRIPVPATSGAFVAGIDETAGGEIVFAIAFFGEFGPDHGSVYLLDTTDHFITELAAIPYAGLNGLAVFEDHWYAVDAFNPMGLIWRGSLSGGSVETWYAGPAVAPDFSYIPSLCNPPFPIGGNGLRLRRGFRFRGLDHPAAFVASNTSGRSIWEVEISADGSAGAATQLFGDLVYPDDIWPSRFCGDAFLATHGAHRVFYVDPGGAPTELLDGTVCDGPTAVVVHDGYVYVSCGGDPLICHPDEFGDPDPATAGLPGQPSVIRAPLEHFYDLICQP